MNKIIYFIKTNPKTIITLTVIVLGMLIALYFEVDVRVIAITTIIVGFITKAFAGLGTIIALIPVIGPLIIKVFTIPFFWFLNGLGYFTSAYAIKKGYGKDVLNHRVIISILLIGVVIGYVIGHIIPIR